MVDTRIPFWILLPAIFYGSLLYGQEPAIGFVKSGSGRPIPDVLVCARSYECLKTDSEGHYDLAKISKRAYMLRFSKEGYKPLIKALEGATSSLETTLVEGDSTLWNIPACKDKRKREGYSIKVTVPKGTEVAKGRDIDYTTINFRFGRTKQWMQVGTGMNWSSGMPFKDDVDNSVEISDRDIRFPRASFENMIYLDGIDIHGRLKDGTRWRYTGYAFETLSYRNVSEAAAKFFDSIIDSGCYQRSMVESK
jgi:hypothetical protein